jgi:hypothetical protein
VDFAGIVREIYVKNGQLLGINLANIPTSSQLAYECPSFAHRFVPIQSVNAIIFGSYVAGEQPAKSPDG